MDWAGKFHEIFGFSLIKTQTVNFTTGALLALIAACILTHWLLDVARRLLGRKLDEDGRNKFDSIFQYLQYLVYFVVLLITLNLFGINIGVLLTASAAIFLGLGFALKQVFQDLIAGVFIILDQSLKVGDIIEISDKVCRVRRISLRSTQAITRNDRVMIIPNHVFMNDVLFNWTQNSPVVRESISVGVAYGSDTLKVRELLLRAALEEPNVHHENATVLFEDFAESALQFTLYFYLSDVFNADQIKSDLRFAIDKLFREAGVSIPFPQRDIHIVTARQ